MLKIKGREMTFLELTIKVGHLRVKLLFTEFLCQQFVWFIFTGF